MKRTKFTSAFCLLVFIQVILARYAQIPPCLYISILPALILCMPTTWDSWKILPCAFLCGMLTDIVADGIPGLNAAAILPVALIRQWTIRKLIDEELVERGYDIAFDRHILPRLLNALALCTTLYFVIYVLLDGSWCRSFLFSLARLLTSSAVSFIFGIAACRVLCPDKKN